jgi:exopolysaccharide biosynthesis protein
VLVLIFLAAASRDTIEKMVLERSLAGAFGGDATIGTLYHTSSGVVVENLHITTAGGSETIASSRLAYAVNGDTWDVTPADLHLTVAVDRLRGDELTGAQSSAHVLNMRRLMLHLKNASVSLTRVAPAVKLEIAGITGTLDALADLHYDLEGNVVGDTGAYPFTATDTAWTAAAVPLAPIVALLGIPDVVVGEGDARAVAFAPDAAGALGTFTLSGVRGSIAGYALHDLAGQITVVGDGIGSTGLDGVLADGTPVAAVGEVHDGLNWSQIFSSGTRDLRALSRMFALIARQPDHRWMNIETTAPGVTFGQYAMVTKTVPHVVQLIEVDPHEPTLHFDTALADDHIISKGARTSDLGLRTNAIVGANGDYFDIGRTYEPQGLLIKSGVLLHGPTDREAVVIDKQNKATFALFHLRGSAVDGARRYPITLYNSWPTRESAIITPDYGPLLPAAPGVRFASLSPLGDGQYRVTAIRPMTTAMPTEFGIGFGGEIHARLPNVGDTLTMHYALDPPVPGAVAAIGSGPLLLKDGQWFEDKHAPAPDERDVQWPVIAIGTMPADTYMFAAVDGRHPDRSIGMTRPEFGELLRGFGMIDAMALDSGGSVTLVSRAPGNSAITVRNVPSDFDAERYVSDALFVYSSAPLGSIVTKARPHVEPSPFAVAPLVLNVVPSPLPAAVPTR